MCVLWRPEDAETFQDMLTNSTMNVGTPGANGADVVMCVFSLKEDVKRADVLRMKHVIFVGKLASWSVKSFIGQQKISVTHL